MTEQAKDGIESVQIRRISVIRGLCRTSRRDWRNLFAVIIVAVAVTIYRLALDLTRPIDH